MHKVSPSQIATFLECNRKWFYQTVLRKPRSQHPSAAKGEKVHKILEGYLETGIVVAPETPEGPELAAIAECGIHHLPDPRHFKVDLESNWSFTQETAEFGPIFYNGRKDLEYDAADGIWTVGDHKTTSNLRYALTQAQLRTDPQGILYGAQAIRAHNRDKVRLTWIYYQTKRPYKSKLVEVVVDEAHVEAELWKLDEIVGRRMLPLVPQKDLPPSQVEANLASCDKYGGCPYREICDVSPVARLRHVFTKFDVAENPLGIEKEGNEDMSNAMSKLEMLKAAKAGLAKPASTETPKPAEGPAVNPPENESVTEAKASEAEAMPTPPDTAATETPKAEPTKPKAEKKEKATKAQKAAEPKPAQAVESTEAILFLDCAISGSLFGTVVISDAALYAKAAEGVKAEMGVEDYSLADFGKGAGAFSVLFAEALTAAIEEAKQGGVRTVLLLCDTSCREWSVTSSAWRAAASGIVKG